MDRRVISLKKIQLFMLLIGWGASMAHAERMSLEAHNIVIEKLESSLSRFKNGDRFLDATSLRLQLANLYSDKTRILLIEEGKKGCNGCLKSDSFRKKAIEQYQVIRPKLKGIESDQVTLQLAHLLESDEKSEQALKLYNELIKKSGVTPNVRASAYSKRAANYFSLGQFDRAIADYNVVLKNSRPEEKGPILHKIAWCEFNKGNADIAINRLMNILSNDELLQGPAQGGFEYSPVFHSEVAKDLAIFMVKTHITNQSLDQLLNASPEEDAIDNLILLGDEAERTGQNEAAVLAWSRALKSKDFPDDRRAEIHFKVAKIYREEGRYSEANKFYTKALELTKERFGNDPNEKSCNGGCKDLLKNFKSYLSAWDKEASKLTSPKEIEKSKTSLLQAYLLYHRFNDTDFETNLWMAQLAVKLNKPEVARYAYAHAADLIAAHSTPNNQKLLEPTLVSEIEMAERLGKKEQTLKSYDHYLALNPYGTTNNSVRYNKAKILYDLNRWKESYELFNENVESKRFVDANLKLKSAHLALDSLVLLKDIENLEAKSFDYSKDFPKEAKEFLQISRKAGIQIVKKLALSDTSSKGAEKALAKMSTINIYSDDKVETQSLLKMKIDLAMKAQDWEMAQKTLGEYRALPKLALKDIAWALSKSLGLAELFLDFKQAYRLILEMGFANSQRPTDLLKGALLAELSGQNPIPWLNKVISNRKTTSTQSQLARAQIVRINNYRWSTLKQQASELGRQPQLLADLALEAYIRNSNPSDANWALRQRGVTGTWSGQMLHRALLIGDIQKLVQTLRNQKLNGRTNQLLVSSLKGRIQNLGDLKELFIQAQRHQDWSLQMITGSHLKEENFRLAQDITNLPVPRTLSPNERKSYVAELSQQAAPFNAAAKELETFLEKSWGEKSVIKNLFTKAENSQNLSGLIVAELKAIAKVAPESIADDIHSDLEDLEEEKDSSDVASLINKLRRDPLDKELSQELIATEKKLGHQPMVVFLESRNLGLKGEAL